MQNEMEKGIGALKERQVGWLPAKKTTPPPRGVILDLNLRPGAKSLAREDPRKPGLEAVVRWLHVLPPFEAYAATCPWARPLKLAINYQYLTKLVFLLQDFANFWRARSRLYQSEILQENMRLTAFFKLYKICIFLHRPSSKFSQKIGLKNQQFL